MRIATIALLASLGLLLAACSSKSPSITRDEARQLLVDRNWIDRMPETPRDHLFVYRFVPSMGGGVFQDRTLFKGTFELFRFRVDGDRIAFDLPETDQRVTSAYRIEKVSGPKPFDLKLTIDGAPRGPHTYYGIRAETDRDGSKLDSELAAAAQAQH